jgi:large subunit ribosomal protein L24
MRKIQKGDTVKIITGKDRGNIGVVSSVITKDNKVIIEGQNIYKKSIKATSEKEGSIADKAMPIHISNVMLVVDKDKTTRVAFKVEKGKKTRVAVKTGKKI